MKMTPLMYRALLDTSNSGIAFASASNSRWNLTAGTIGWTNVSTLATLMFVEGATTTASSIFFQFDVSTSQGTAAFRLGRFGIQASDSGTSMRFIAGSAESGSYSVMFSGYYTGGG